MKGSTEKEVEFPGLIKKENIMLTFKSSFLALEFLSGVTQFHGSWNSQGYSFVLPRISKDKVMNLKISGPFSKKV